MNKNGHVLITGAVGGLGTAMVHRLLGEGHTIFDYNTVGSAKRPHMRYDLPGGGRRLVMPAHGVQYTIVNGEILYADQQHSGVLPGQVLRSGGI